MQPIIEELRKASMRLLTYSLAERDEVDSVHRRNCRLRDIAEEMECVASETPLSPNIIVDGWISRLPAGLDISPSAMTVENLLTWATNCRQSIVVLSDRQIEVLSALNEYNSAVEIYKDQMGE